MLCVNQSVSLNVVINICSGGSVPSFQTLPQGDPAAKLMKLYREKTLPDSQ